ncbi:MAG: phenylalanine--tRNA ligase subunit beta [Thermodesulfobacteriota bacterium]
MLFSYDWLREYIDELPSPGVLSERLTMTGTEVESVAGGAESPTGVVTAEVLSVEAHPNADRLSLCEVRTDTGSHSIVCGATNMKPGDRVALALPGAVLPGGHRIKKSKIRGVTSEGMMCSEVELALADTSDGIMILPADTPLGVDVNDVLVRDVVLEASVTPNRADLLSIRGIAREIAAVVGGTFRDRSPEVAEEGPDIKGLVDVAVEDAERCPRYSARVIEGVRIAPSPEPIVKRLEALGVRPVNNVVDVTNYVLLGLGQPLHAFDLDRLAGRRIVVRPARAGERIETIDGKTRDLPEGALVIADSASPVALAGVMGGKATEVGDGTTDVLIESAWFEPSAVRRSSKEAALSTDSSYRFERGVDIEGVTLALDTAAAMITEIAGGRVARGSIDVYPEPKVPAAIELDPSRVGALLGIELEDDEVLRILKGLGIKTRTAPGRGAESLIEAVPPSYRLDITGEVDLIEEVARVAGYDRIPATLPATGLVPGARSAHHEARGLIRDLLAGSGFFEVVNYSFISRDLYAVTAHGVDEGVAILNPLSEDQALLRASLVPSLVDNLRKNIQKGSDDVRIFELSTVFIPRPERSVPHEGWRVAGLLYGRRWAEAWNMPADPVDFFDVKGAVESIIDVLGPTGEVVFEPLGDGSGGALHPGKSARALVSGAEVGILGETHPDLDESFGLRAPAYVFELDLDILLDVSGREKTYTRLARFPSSARDVAFVVDDSIPYGEIHRAITGLDTKLIETIELFDVYYGGSIPEGKRSLALRVVCRSPERTLKQAEVDRVCSRVVKTLTRRFGAEVRGE